MKKKITAALAGIALFVCLFGAHSCSKIKNHSAQEITTPVDRSDVSNLKTWYYLHWKNSGADAARTSSWLHDTSFLTNNLINLIPDWRFAQVVYQGTVKYTQVPATFPDTLELKVGSTDSTAMFNNLSDTLYRDISQSKTFWVAREAPGEDPYAEIVTFVGDYEYVKADYLRFHNGIGYFDLTGYSGLVAYHDREGKLLRVFRYLRGELVNTIRCSTEVRLDPEPMNRVHVDECYEVWTYERDCITTYSEQGVNKQCSDWTFVGSYMIGNCFGGTSGSTGGTNYYNPVSEDGLGCGSFDFRPTASDWQEAGVNELRINFVWLGGSHYGKRVNITLGAPIVFGMPRKKADGSFYKPGEAAKLAAEASDLAHAMTAQILKNEPYLPEDHEVEATYRKWVDLFMKNNRGTAGRTGSRSPLIVFRTATYKFLGNGDCE
jgi:hypothetical protein